MMVILHIRCDDLLGLAATKVTFAYEASVSCFDLRVMVGLCGDYGYAYHGGLEGKAPSFRQLAAILAAVPKSELPKFDPRRKNASASLEQSETEHSESTLCAPLSPLQFCLAVMPIDAAPTCSPAVQGANAHTKFVCLPFVFPLFRIG